MFINNIFGQTLFLMTFPKDSGLWIAYETQEEHECILTEWVSSQYNNITLLCLLQYLWVPTPDMQQWHGCGPWHERIRVATRVKPLVCIFRGVQNERQIWHKLHRTLHPLPWGLFSDNWNFWHILLFPLNFRWWWKICFWEPQGFFTNKRRLCYVPAQKYNIRMLNPNWENREQRAQEVRAPWRWSPGIHPKPNCGVQCHVFSPIWILPDAQHGDCCSMGVFFCPTTRGQHRENVTWDTGEFTWAQLCDTFSAWTLIHSVSVIRPWINILRPEVNISVQQIWCLAHALWKHFETMTSYIVGTSYSIHGL